MDKEYWTEIFNKCPDSQIDIKLTLCSSPDGFEVDYVIEGTDEWGTQTHIASNIVNSLVVAGVEIGDVLRNRAALAQADKQESPEKCHECGDDLGDDAILGTCPACAFALAGDAYQ